MLKNSITIVFFIIFDDVTIYIVLNIKRNESLNRLRAVGAQRRTRRHTRTVGPRAAAPHGAQHPHWPARQREACKAGPWWAGEAVDSNNYEQREHKTQRRTANRHRLNPTTPPVTTSAAFCITWIMRGRNRLENSRPL